jgi:hypothetical protein
VRAVTRGVAGSTGLLSPEVVDFPKAATVIADGRTEFEGHVRKGLAPLMKWASRDNGRTMLSGAGTRVTLAP